MISYMTCCGSLAAANPAPGPAQRADANDGGHEHDADLDLPMDSDEERHSVYADQNIFSNQPAWMFFQISQKSCVQTMGSRRGQCGSTIRIANPIRLSAGCLQNLPRGSARTMGRSFRYTPSATWSGRQGS